MEQPGQHPKPSPLSLLQLERLTIVGGITALSVASVWIVVPALPKFVDLLGGGPIFVGLALSVFGAARLLINIPAGNFCERWGRKRVLLIGALGAGTFATLSGSSGGVEILLAYRFLAGLFAGMVIIAGSVVVMDLTSVENRGRYLSFVHGWQLVVFISSPGLGGLLADLISPRAPFYASGVGVLTFGLWALLRLPETRPKLPAGQTAPASVGLGETVANIRTLLGNRSFLLICLLSFAMFFTRVGSGSSLIPLMAYETLDWSPSRLGLLFSSGGLLGIVTLYPSGHLADRLGRKPVMVPSFLLVSVGIFLLPWSEGPVLFITAFYIMHLGSSFGGQAPVAYVGDVVPPRMRGLGFGVFRTFGDLAFVIAPVTTTGLSQAFNFFAGFYLNAFLMLGAILIVAVFAKETAGRTVRARVEEPSPGSPGPGG